MTGLLEIMPPDKTIKCLIVNCAHQHFNFDSLKKVKLMHSDSSQHCIQRVCTNCVQQPLLSVSLL